MFYDELLDERRRRLEAEQFDEKPIHTGRFNSDE